MTRPKSPRPTARRLTASLGHRLGKFSDPPLKPRWHDRARIADQKAAEQRRGALSLARILGIEEPSAFTCDGCPCAPRCRDSYDLDNVNGYCVAIGRGPDRVPG